jgi:LAO/AO transport system kinase
LPNAGDDLQAIKKGVMELADLVVINKADIDPDAATRAQAQITSAMRLFTQHGREKDWQAKVIQLSALTSEGIDRFWQVVTQFQESQAANGKLESRRRHQALAWMWERIEAGLKHEFRDHPAVRQLLPALTQEVEAGRLPASTAARQLLEARRH